MGIFIWKKTLLGVADLYQKPQMPGAWEPRSLSVKQLLVFPMKIRSRITDHSMVIKPWTITIESSYMKFLGFLIDWYYLSIIDQSMIKVIVNQLVFTLNSFNCSNQSGCLSNSWAARGADVWIEIQMHEVAAASVTEWWIVWKRFQEHLEWLMGKSNLAPELMVVTRVFLGSIFPSIQWLVG